MDMRLVETIATAIMDHKFVVNAVVEAMCKRNVFAWRRMLIVVLLDGNHHQDMYQLKVDDQLAMNKPMFTCNKPTLLLTRYY